MANNFLDSFAVALGFKVDQSALNTAKRSIADYEKAVREAEKRIEDARWAGAKSEQEIAKLTRETNLKEAREALSRAQQREQQEKDLEKKRKERAADLAKTFSQIAIAATAAATAIGYAVARVTGSFDNLYFQAQRAGTSVESLKALGYAFSQTGGSAQQAVAAVENFSTKLRNNPGLRQFVKDLGVADNLPAAEKWLATVDELRQEPREIGVQHAEMLGISEQDFDQYIRQREAMIAADRKYRENAKRFGLDSDAAARASTSFQRSLTELQSVLSILADKLLVQLAPALEAAAKGFTDWLADHPEKIQHILDSITHGIERFTEMLKQLITWFAGSDGDKLTERWDQFADRVDKVAKAVETIARFFERISYLVGGLSDAKNSTNTVWGNPGRATALLNSLNNEGGGGGGGGGGAPGGGGGGDDRNLWQRYAPKILGGKDAPGGGGATPPGSSMGSLTTLSEAEAKRAGIDPRYLHGIRMGESLRGDKYDVKSDAQEDSHGPFQLNRRGGLGQVFEKKTGLDVRDPRTIPAQVRFVAEHIAAKLKANPNYNPGTEWYGYKGLQNAGANWGDSGYKPTQEAGNVAPVDGAGGVTQAQSGTRNQPVSDLLKSQLAAAAKASGTNAEIFSGGQDSDGPRRVGSHRHDHGNAADVRLYVFNPDGSKRYLSQNNEADRKVMESFLREGVKAGATGIGAGPGYMGDDKMHIGGGPAMAWGAGGSSANAPDWVRRALEQGMSERGKPAAGAAPSMTRPNMTPGGFDVNKLDAVGVMKAAPMGSVSNDNSTNSRSVTQHIKNNTTIHGSSNPKDHGRIIESSLARSSSMALANAQSAIG